MTKKMYDDSLEGTTIEFKEPEIIIKISNTDKIRKVLSDGAHSYTYIMEKTKMKSGGNLNQLLKNMIIEKEVKKTECDYCDSKQVLYKLI